MLFCNWRSFQETIHSSVWCAQRKILNLLKELYLLHFASEYDMILSTWWQKCYRNAAFIWVLYFFKVKPLTSATCCMPCVLQGARQPRLHLDKLRTHLSPCIFELRTFRIQKPWQIKLHQTPTSFPIHINCPFLSFCGFCWSILGTQVQRKTSKQRHDEFRGSLNLLLGLSLDMHLKAQAG